jgi:hypothetical protein
MHRPLVVGLVAAALIGAFSLAPLLLLEEAAAVEGITVEAGPDGAAAAYNAIPIQAVAEATEEGHAAAEAAAAGGGAAAAAAAAGSAAAEAAAAGGGAAAAAAAAAEHGVAVDISIP